MNHYEMLCILDPGLGAEGRRSPQEVVKEELDKIGAEISLARDMGRRRLAYQIGDFSDGYYQLVYFAADPASLEGLRASMKLNPDVVRVLILKGKPPVNLEYLNEASLDSVPPRPVSAPGPEVSEDFEEEKKEIPSPVTDSGSDISPDVPEEQNGFTSAEKADDLPEEPNKQL